MCVVISVVEPVWSLFTALPSCGTVCLRYWQFSQDDMLSSLQYYYGETALMIASENGHMECVKVLLVKGADVNVQSTVSVVV